MLSIGTKVVVTKGNKAMKLSKGQQMTVHSLRNLGVVCGHDVMMTFAFFTPNSTGFRTFCTRYMSRVQDPARTTYNLNYGDGINRATIEVVK